MKKPISYSAPSVLPFSLMSKNFAAGSIVIVAPDPHSSCSSQATLSIARLGAGSQRSTHTFC